MEPKYSLYQFVEVDGTYTGLGDLVGPIKDIEYCTVSEQYFYLIRVYGQLCETLFVPERYLSISDRSQRLDRIINIRRILERHTK
jgi:hypothetical protein